jgi:hypothetical protein
MGGARQAAHGRGSAGPAPRCNSMTGTGRVGLAGCLAGAQRGHQPPGVRPVVCPTRLARARVEAEFGLRPSPHRSLAITERRGPLPEPPGPRMAFLQLTSACVMGHPQPRDDQPPRRLLGHWWVAKSPKNPSIDSTSANSSGCARCWVGPGKVSGLSRECMPVIAGWSP